MPSVIKVGSPLRREGTKAAGMSQCVDVRSFVGGLLSPFLSFPFLMNWAGKAFIYAAHAMPWLFNLCLL